MRDSHPMNLNRTCLITTLTVPVMAFACGGEARKSNLPAPEYERPARISWNEIPDAGTREPTQTTPDTSPGETTAVGGEGDEHSQPDHGRRHEHDFSTSAGPESPSVRP